MSVSQSLGLMRFSFRGCSAHLSHNLLPCLWHHLIQSLWTAHSNLANKTTTKLLTLLFKPLWSLVSYVPGQTVHSSSVWSSTLQNHMKNCRNVARKPPKRHDLQFIIRWDAWGQNFCFTLSLNSELPNLKWRRYHNKSSLSTVCTMLGLCRCYRCSWGNSSVLLFCLWSSFAHVSSNLSFFNLYV